MVVPVAHTMVVPVVRTMVVQVVYTMVVPVVRTVVVQVVHTMIGQVVRTMVVQVARTIAVQVVHTLNVMTEHTPAVARTPDLKRNRRETHHIRTDWLKQTREGSHRYIMEYKCLDIRYRIQITFIGRRERRCSFFRCRTLIC